MYLSIVDHTEILKLVGQPENSFKSPGPDGIGPKLMKEIRQIICDPLVHIFNLSLSQVRVPDRLKIAKVVPIIKKGDRQLVCNFRSISLLSCFFLINCWKKVVKNRLYHYFQANNFLYTYQFGT